MTDPTDLWDIIDELRLLAPRRYIVQYGEYSDHDITVLCHLSGSHSSDKWHDMLSNAQAICCNSEIIMHAGKYLVAISDYQVDIYVYGQKSTPEKVGIREYHPVAEDLAKVLIRIKQGIRLHKRM